MFSGRIDGREGKMKEFTLKNREEDTLKLNIGENSYQIPLATSMTIDEALKMETTEGAIEFFKKYIGSEVADTLTIANYTDIILAWRAASKESAHIGGANLGES